MDAGVAPSEIVKIGPFIAARIVTVTMCAVHQEKMATLCGLRSHFARDHCRLRAFWDAGKPNRKQRRTHGPCETERRDKRVIDIMDYWHSARREPSL